jgi:hypothetical protein
MRARRASRHMRGASTDVLCTIVGVRANDVWKGVKGWIWDMSRSAMSSCSRPTERLSRRVSLCACVGSGARVSPRYQRLDQKIWGQATGTDPRLIASVGRGRCVDARPHVVDGVEREGGGDVDAECLEKAELRIECAESRRPKRALAWHHAGAATARSRTAESREGPRNQVRSHFRGARRAGA